MLAACIVSAEDFRVRRRERQAEHGPKRVCVLAVVFDRLIKSVADMREGSGVFGKGRKSFSHMDTMSVSLEKRSRP